MPVYVSNCTRIMLFSADGDIGTVGISQHACDALGDIVFVELPTVGSTFDAG